MNCLRNNKINLLKLIENYKIRLSSTGKSITNDKYLVTNHNKQLFSFRPNIYYCVNNLPNYHFITTSSSNATSSNAGNNKDNNNDTNTGISPDPIGSELLDIIVFETICADTLEGLCEYFDNLVEQSTHLKSADVSYSDGVLTVNFGNSYGTYVINRQTPNRQIWLSSPTSGPKRYDFISTATNDGRSTNNQLKNNKDQLKGYWMYKYDKKTLHELLQTEMKRIIKRDDVDFVSLPFGNRDN